MKSFDIYSFKCGVVINSFLSHEHIITFPHKYFTESLINKIKYNLINFTYNNIFYYFIIFLI